MGVGTGIADSGRSSAVPPDRESPPADSARSVGPARKPLGRARWRRARQIDRQTEMCQDLLDHPRLFNRRHQAQAAATIGARQNVKFENPAEKLCPWKIAGAHIGNVFRRGARRWQPLAVWSGGVPSRRASARARRGIDEFLDEVSGGPWGKGQTAARRRVPSRSSSPGAKTPSTPFTMHDR